MTPPPPTPRVVLVVALGAAAGAVLRAVLGEAFPEPSGQFPWTTFGVNLAGSFLLALLPAAAVVRRHALLPPLLGTGVLGGFTTLSAYSEQTRALYAGGQQALAGGYLIGTLAACLVAVVLADRLSSAAARAEFEAEEGDL